MNGAEVYENMQQGGSYTSVYLASDSKLITVWRLRLLPILSNKPQLLYKMRLLNIEMSNQF